jgi:hypothetical protein
MKITKAELKQMIKEELTNTIGQEQQIDEIVPVAAAGATIMPMIMKALKNPEVQKMLIDMLMPMIQKAMGGAGGAPAE